jgi:membrane associated rhomboid family serine protease
MVYGLQVLQVLQSFYIPYDFMTAYFGLIPWFVATKGFVWQIFTYMFLHGSPMHLFLNMYGIFIFGIMVEEVWGGRKFLLYYLFCGTGAGISIFLLNLIMGGSAYYAPTIGASGAMFGLLLAFGVLFPNAELLFFFVLPIKAKYLVIIYGGMELYFELSGGMSSISHVGHLGGLLFGILYFLFFERNRWLKKRIRKVSEKTGLAAAGNGSALRIIPRKDPDQEKKKEIIRKLEEKGSIDVLTEDEYQFVKYLDIMIDPGTLRGVHHVDVTDEHISDRQFLEIINKYR